MTRFFRAGSTPARALREAFFGLLSGFINLIEGVDGVEHLLHLGDEELLVKHLVEIEVANLGADPRMT